MTTMDIGEYGDLAKRWRTNGKRGRSGAMDDRWQIDMIERACEGTTRCCMRHEGLREGYCLFASLWIPLSMETEKIPVIMGKSKY